METKPTGRFRCRACGQEWDGSQVFVDPTSLARTLTCGNLFCGGTVDRIPPPDKTDAAIARFIGGPQ